MHALAMFLPVPRGFEDDARKCSIQMTRVISQTNTSGVSVGTSEWMKHKMKHGRLGDIRDVLYCAPVCVCLVPHHEPRAMEASQPEPQ